MTSTKSRDGSAMFARLAEKLAAGDTFALACAISLIDNGEADVGDFVSLPDGLTRSARVVAFTGPPGGGKSSLINAYVAELRRQDRKVAVVSVDPSSPMSGGAVLGDRLRMAEHVLDHGVFIRSIASRGHLGGLCRNIKAIVQVIDSTRAWDLIVLETVGAGQSEVEVVDIADIKVVINTPGLGDEIQALKAGILEIADVLVVNKADLPGAERTARDLRGMLALRLTERQAVPIVETVATTGQGIAQLVETIDGAEAGDAPGPG